MLDLICYCVHDPLTGELRALITTKRGYSYQIDQAGAFIQTTASSARYYFADLAAKSMYFVAKKHKPRGSVRTTLLAPLQSASLLYLSSNYPPVSHSRVVLCLRKVQITRAGVTQRERVYFCYTAHVVWGC